MSKTFKDYYVLKNTDSVRNKLLESQDWEFLFSYEGRLVMARDLLKLYDYLLEEFGQLCEQLRLPTEGDDLLRGNKLLEGFKQLVGGNITIYNNDLDNELEDFPNIRFIIVLDDIFAERQVEKIVISGNNFCFGNFENIKNQIIEVTPTSFSYNEKDDIKYNKSVVFVGNKVSINRNYCWCLDLNTYNAETMFVKLSKEISKIFKFKLVPFLFSDTNLFEVKVILEDGLEIVEELQSSFVELGYEEISKMLSSYFPRMCEKPIYLQ